MALKSPLGTTLRRSRQRLATRLRANPKTRIVVKGMNRLVDIEKRLTGSARIMPDIYVIGSQKAGSTTVWRHLVDHPDVHRNDPKEPHFFDDRWAMGLEWYRGHYPLQAVADLHERRTGHRLRGLDASPSYIFDPHAPRRLASVVPDARLVALLREPVARAYSHHQHAVRRGVEHLSFAEAVAAEPERIAGETEKMLADDTYYSMARGEYSYLYRGQYAEHLERWLNTSIETSS